MMFNIDYEYWHTDVHRHNSVLEFTANLINDGIHSIGLADLPIDVLVRNSSLVENSSYIVVGFNGSFDRGEKKPPFFVLSTIAEKTQLPLISFSDPTLALDEKITLGWYAGNHYYPDLPDTLAEILDQIISIYGKNLLLVGGSGGGFAALNIQRRMREKDRTIAFVWNPQTDLPAFSHILFSRYINVAFPIDGVDLTTAESAVRLRTYSDQVITKKIGADVNCNALILLDGYDVFHLKDHLRHYFSGQESYSFNNSLVFGKQRLLIGDWGLEGDGHCRPSRDTAALFISEIIDKGTTSDLHSVDHATVYGRELFIKGRSPSETKIRIFFNFVDDVLCLESNVSEYFHGYLAKFVLYYHEKNAPIFQTFHISNTARCKTFIRLNDIYLNNSQRLQAEIHIEDFYGEKIVISGRATNPPTKRYKTNIIP